MQQPNVLIVGGGAAGLTAAIAAARRGAAVTILEKGPRVGKKVLASGNGRCNLTNTFTAPPAFNHPDFVEPVLSAYPCEEIRSFFGELGLLTRADDEGRVYPSTNYAASVLEVLRLECARLGVEVQCGFEAVALATAPGSGGFEVSSKSGEMVHGDTVIVTTGGGGALLAATGHTMVDLVPVLGPIRTDTEPIRGLSGVRVRCAATLLASADEDGDARVLSTERGELLFRDYGVSGIMVFDLSRYLEKDCVISIDLFPELSARDLEALIAQRCAALSWRTAGTFFVGMLHDQVMRAVLCAAGIDPETPVEELPQPALAALLKDFRLDVTGMGDPWKAQVTRGGASVAEFDADTMRSRLVDGLLAAGEVLDIDGRSGGFNLHWAWASGIVAGGNAAGSALARAADGDADGKSPA